MKSVKFSLPSSLTVYIVESQEQMKEFCGISENLIETIESMKHSPIIASGANLVIIKDRINFSDEELYSRITPIISDPEERTLFWENYILVE